MTKPTDIDRGLDFTVKALPDPDAHGCRTVIDGTYGGAIRAKGGTKARWRTEDARGFKITVVEFDPNVSAGKPAAAIAFVEPLPPQAVQTFEGTLVTPPGYAPLFFKYTIQIVDCKEADPPIVIEKR